VSNFSKHSVYKIYENAFSGPVVVRGGQTDGHGGSMVACIYCQRQVLVVVVVVAAAAVVVVVSDGKYK
jgi:hypothetical protein